MTARPVGCCAMRPLSTVNTLSFTVPQCIRGGKRRYSELTEGREVKKARTTDPHRSLELLAKHYGILRDPGGSAVHGRVYAREGGGRAAGTLRPAPDRRARSVDVEGTSLKTDGDGQQVQLPMVAQTER